MPHIILLAGPNGAGKSTAAAFLLPPTTTFLNADEMAKEMKSAATDEAMNADRQAARRLLGAMDDLEAARADIAVETTMASRSLAPRIARLKQVGYRFQLLYM